MKSRREMTVIMEVEKRYGAVYLPRTKDITIRTPVTLPAVLNEYLAYVSEKGVPGEYMNQRGILRMNESRDSDRSPSILRTYPAPCVSEADGTGSGSTTTMLLYLVCSLVGWLVANAN
jgi:hypothetical protein